MLRYWSYLQYLGKWTNVYRYVKLESLKSVVSVMWLHIKSLIYCLIEGNQLSIQCWKTMNVISKTKKVSKEKMQNSRNFEILTFFMDLTFANQRKSSPPPILMHIQKPMSQDNDLSYFSLLRFIYCQFKVLDSQHERLN